MRNATVRKALGAAVAAALAIGGVAGTAWAQRDPAYAAARAAGQIGEMMDGYLGIVGQQTPELLRIVKAINIKRREAYALAAPTASPPATLQEYAFATGCQAISATVPGEMYQGPDKAWRTRTAGPAELHPDCKRGSAS